MNNSQLLPNNAVYFLPWITALIMGGLAVSSTFLRVAAALLFMCTISALRFQADFLLPW